LGFFHIKPSFKFENRKLLHSVTPNPELLIKQFLQNSARLAAVDRDFKYWTVVFPSYRASIILFYNLLELPQLDDLCHILLIIDERMI